MQKLVDQRLTCISGRYIIFKKQFSQFLKRLFLVNKAKCWAEGTDCTKSGAEMIGQDGLSGCVCLYFQNF